MEDTTYKGVNCRKHVATLGDQDHNQEDKCYCSKICMKKGVFDLSNCMGAPIYATLPHFLEADETFLKQVDGLNPVEEKHIIRISFEYVKWLFFGFCVYFPLFIFILDDWHAA